MRTFLSGAIILASVTVAQAQTDELAFFTGNTLLARCEGDILDRAQCSGYLQGVLDTFVAGAFRLWDAAVSAGGHD